MADSTSTTVPQVCGICGNTGALFKCGRCKSLYYCSKSCQAKDWPIHKMVCVKPNSKLKDHGVVNMPQGLLSFDDKFQAVYICVKQQNPQPIENTFCYAGSIMQGMDASDPSFVDLPVIHAIGFPMGVRGGEQGLPIFTGPAMQLCISLDTKSAGFGTPFIYLREGWCGACASRWIAHRYLMREAAGEKVDREELVKRLFTPAAFVNGFAIKEKMLKDGSVGWENVECPVVVEDEENTIATGSVTP
ncbi:hypothetical protein LTR17_020062 [Elasticomyces elasticus]|nr:hypothetical protein LTR17_020062 [Elasticomyces elasticus]